MWQGLSLRARLNALFGGLMVFALIISIGWILLAAGPRVKAESQSALRLAREFIETAIGSLKQTPEPEAGLAHLMKGLRNLRHVAIQIEDAQGRVVGTYAAADDDDDDDGPPDPSRTGQEQSASVPAWFANFVQPDRTSVRIPLELSGKSYGAIVLSSDPSDESEEVWSGLVSLTLGGAALALVAFLINILAVNRALAPIGNLGQAVTALEAGRYHVHVPLNGSPELVDICGKVNSLAGTLERTTNENRQLSEMLVTLQDDERKELARELHDEFGPYLFAIRAGIKSLQRDFGQYAEQPDASERCAMLQEQVDALQQINRRVLDRLRPAAMTELGLQEALRALVAMWKDANPSVAVSLEMPEDIDDLEETAALTVYRVVQEGLTNVFRHSGATLANIRISHVPGDANETEDSLRISIKDNGVGMSDDAKPGFGLIGMRERVWALNGKMSVLNAPEGGVIVEVLVPLSQSIARETFPTSAASRWF
jgi:two-component system sensor histidine kinase UhpB